MGLDEVINKTKTTLALETSDKDYNNIDYKRQENNRMHGDIDPCFMMKRARPTFM